MINQLFFILIIGSLTLVGLFVGGILIQKRMTKDAEKRREQDLNSDKPENPEMKR